ncbi:hypothetical protein ABZ746_17550 [Streptomyces sp. NPDC020096]
MPRDDRQALDAAVGDGGVHGPVDALADRQHPEVVQVDVRTYGRVVDHGGGLGAASVLVAKEHQLAARTTSVQIGLGGASLAQSPLSHAPSWPYMTSSFFWSRIL